MEFLALLEGLVFFFAFQTLPLNFETCSGCPIFIRSEGFKSASFDLPRSGQWVQKCGNLSKEPALCPVLVTLVIYFLRDLPEAA